MENIIGYAVKQIRKEKKITQEELAKLTGFGQPTISNHENGNRALDEIDIQVYSKALNVSPQYLFDIVSKGRTESNVSIQGNNNGIAGMSGDINGSITFNTTEKDEHSICREQEVADNSTADLAVQEQIFNHLEVQTVYLQQLFQQAKNHTDILEEILDEFKKINKK